MHKCENFIFCVLVKHFSSFDDVNTDLKMKRLLIIEQETKTVTLIS